MNRKKAKKAFDSAVKRRIRMFFSFLPCFPCSIRTVGSDRIRSQGGNRPRLQSRNKNIRESVMHKGGEVYNKFMR